MNVVVLRPGASKGEKVSKELDRHVPEEFLPLPMCSCSLAGMLLVRSFSQRKLPDA